MTSSRSKLAAATVAFLRVLAVCIPVLMLFGLLPPGAPESAQAQQNPRAGFLKQGVINGGANRDTYWTDSDGVSPGVAGCHVEVTGPNNRARPPGGRTIGERCESGTILVETNPGANTIHRHANDVGHPDRVDCNAWCKGAQGRSGGTCQRASAPPCASSARCVCN